VKQLEANLELGDWIIAKFRKKGKFAEKIGADPTLVSRWLSGKGISDEYQAKIRKLGYTGSWPRESAGPSDYVTRAEFEEALDAVEDSIVVIRALLQSLPEGSRPLALPKRFR
jgi:hypothetical protein